MSARTRVPVLTAIAAAAIAFGGVACVRLAQASGAPAAHTEPSGAHAAHPEPSGASAAHAEASGAPAAHAASVAPPPGSDCGQTITMMPRQAGTTPPPLAIGDSVLYEAAPALAALGFEVNATVCRSMPQGIQWLAARAGALPSLVIVELGTNGTVSSGEIEQLLVLLGPQRILGLVTPTGPDAVAGSLMRAQAAADPGRIRLLDWQRLSAGQKGWFAPDGVHLAGPAAIDAFAQLLSSALVDVPASARGAGASGSAAASPNPSASPAPGGAGATGASGPSGAFGLSGASGTSGPSGASGSSGPSGASGSSGTAGSSGTSGSSGTAGVRGASGAAASSATARARSNPGSTAARRRADAASANRPAAAGGAWKHAIGAVLAQAEALAVACREWLSDW